MPEGTFPKSDGDILFASESNKFFNAGTFYETGSNFRIISGTGFTTVGSALIGAGSLGNPAIIDISCWVQKPASSIMGFEISGAGVNTQITVGSPSAIPNIARSKIFVGSPMVGNLEGYIYHAVDNTDDTQNRIFWGAGSILHLDTTLATVVKINMQTNGVGLASGIVNWGIYSTGRLA